MSTYSFISVMGTQIMGTINPLLSLVTDGYIVSKVYLLISDDVLEVGSHFEEFCNSINIETEIRFVSMPPDPCPSYPYARDAVIEIAQEINNRGERCIFNINGSTNQMITQCSLALVPFNTLLLQATKQRVLLDDNRNLRQCSAANVIEVEKLLALQGAEIQSFSPTTEDFNILSFCKIEKIQLPPHALVNKEIGGVQFELIWTDANNRPIFLVSCLNKTNDENYKLRLATERNLSHWAASKNKSQQLFDRQVYALTDSSNTAEHLTSESNGKIKIIDCRGYTRNKSILTNALLDLFKKQEMHHGQNIQQKKRKALELEENTLIVAMGKDPSATLLTINTHKPDHVMLCHTEELQEQATILRQNLDSLNLKSIRLVPCDIEGAVLPVCFAQPQEKTNINVNITPGTKGQGVYLALWAQKNKCGVWAVQPQTQTIERLDAKAKPLQLQAPDPMLLFKVKGERMSCDIEEQKTYYNRNTALLSFLSSALGHERVNDIFKSAVKINGVTLHRPALKEWELRISDGTIFPFSLEGGEWLELLAAQAFYDAGAHFSHARVRNLGSEKREEKILIYRGLDAKTHLMDIDVLGSYKGGYFLVSCKANPNTPIEETVLEAVRMAKAVDRFTIVLVCHLGCNKAYYDEKYNVVILGWRELCQPELLKEYMETLRNSFDKHKENR